MRCPLGGKMSVYLNTSNMFILNQAVKTTTEKYTLSQHIYMNSSRGILESQLDILESHLEFSVTSRSHC
jgi:hypothetical protein